MSTATHLDDRLVNGAFVLSAITRALDEDPYCGDCCAWWEQDRQIYLFLADGLGHGEWAHAAATAALASIRNRTPAPLADLVAQCDRDIRHTRGVALGLAVIDGRQQKLQFCGIGNIRARMIGQEGRQFYLPCEYGIVGAGCAKLTAETHPFPPGTILIMASDGIAEHFTVPTELMGTEWTPRQLSEQIVEQWAKATDDAAVLVCQARQGIENYG